MVFVRFFGAKNKLVWGQLPPVPRVYVLGIAIIYKCTPECGNESILDLEKKLPVGDFLLHN